MSFGGFDNGNDTNFVFILQGITDFTSACSTHCICLCTYLQGFDNGNEHIVLTVMLSLHLFMYLPFKKFKKSCGEKVRFFIEPFGSRNSKWMVKESGFLFV